MPEVGVTVTSLFATGGVTSAIFITTPLIDIRLVLLPTGSTVVDATVVLVKQYRLVAGAVRFDAAVATDVQLVGVVIVRAVVDKLLEVMATTKPVSPLAILRGDDKETEEASVIPLLPELPPVGAA
jgi:hypothetical protein